MAYSEMTCERQGPVAYIHLDRPAVRNALSPTLITSLTSTIEQLSGDPSVRVIVLSGKGPHFCAGADLEWMRASVALDAEGNRREAETLGRLFATIDASPKAVIGDIHGASIGGGAGLVAVCDYVIASETAFFRFSEVRLGLIPAVIAPYVLAKIGPSATRAFFTSGESFDVFRAREIGLIHEVVPPSAHDGTLARVIGGYLAGAPGAIAAAKALLAELIHEPTLPAVESAAYTANAIAERRVSTEAQQGLAAFLEHGKVPWLI